MLYDYQHYKNLRNNTWEILIDTEIHTLPVKISTVCKKLGIGIQKYNVAESEALFLNYAINGIPQYKDAFTFESNGNFKIFYNEASARQNIRFAVAHELGHIIEGDTQRRFLNNESEKQADMFATRILAPACVLWGLDLHSPEDIARVCDIPLRVAQKRAVRMEVLYERNKFLISPTEQEIYRQFYAFIQDNKSF